MLLKVGTQVSNALKITLTKFHQHLSCGSQVFKGWHNDNERLTTQKEFSRLCYRPLDVAKNHARDNMQMSFMNATHVPVDNPMSHM